MKKAIPNRKPFWMNTTSCAMATLAMFTVLYAIFLAAFWTTGMRSNLVELIICIPAFWLSLKFTKLMMDRAFERELIVVQAEMDERQRMARAQIAEGKNKFSFEDLCAIPSLVSGGIGSGKVSPPGGVRRPSFFQRLRVKAGGLFR